MRNRTTAVLRLQTSNRVKVNGSVLSICLRGARQGAGPWGFLNHRTTSPWLAGRSLGCGSVTEQASSVEEQERGGVVAAQRRQWPFIVRAQKKCCWGKGLQGHGSQPEEGGRGRKGSDQGHGRPQARGGRTAELIPGAWEPAGQGKRRDGHRRCQEPGQGQGKGSPGQGSPGAWPGRQGMAASERGRPQLAPACAGALWRCHQRGQEATLSVSLRCWAALLGGDPSI